MPTELQQSHTAAAPTADPAATPTTATAAPIESAVLLPGQANTAERSGATAPPETAPSKTSPTDAEDSRPLPPGWAPRYWPKVMDEDLTPRRPQLQQAAVPADTVRLTYDLTLQGGKEEVVRVRSELVLPMALEVENLPQTDLSFPQLVDQIIVRPLVTKFRAFLQRRFDAASRAEAEVKAAAAEPPPQPVNPGFKPAKPNNGKPVALPEIDPQPPLFKPPGSQGRPAGQ